VNAVAFLSPLTSSDTCLLITADADKTSRTLIYAKEANDFITLSSAGTLIIRHIASTSVYGSRYSLTFCVRVMLPERHESKPAVQDAAVMLRTPPSPASHRPAARAHPAERSHYVVVSRDGRKLVTRVRVMLA